MRPFRTLYLTPLLVATLACSGLGLPTTPQPRPPTPTPLATSVAKLPTVPPSPANVDVYDPARDPAQDLQAAITAAQAENKRILLEVGGEWCVWCHYMDAFYVAHPDLQTLRDSAYVLVKVNFSEENMNTDFLGQYPEIAGYPHIFILDSDGTFVHSQNTADLEEGESYNLERFQAFLQTWAKP